MSQARVDIASISAVCKGNRRVESDNFDHLANAYCNYEELTDFKFNSLANYFYDYKKLKDFCSDKILQGIG